MATFSTAAKAAMVNAMASEVLSQIDGGTGAATLEIGSAGMASVLATITLAEPAGTVTGGVLTFTMPQSDASADASGTAAAARVKDGDGTVVIDAMTVGTSGSEVNLDSVSITAGQTVTINSGTITVTLP